MVLGVLVAAVSVGSAFAEEERLVTGTVVDASGEPVSDARVEVRAAAGSGDTRMLATGRSGADGTYAVGPLPVLPSSVQLRVSKAGFATDDRMTFAGSRNSFRLTPGGGVRGVLRWERSGEPVAGVELELSGDGGRETTTTSEAGEYVFAGVRPGSHWLATRWTELPVLGAVRVEVAPGPPATRDVWVSLGTTLFGRVTSADGEPLAGAVVQCGSLVATTSAKGEYRLAGIPPCGTHDHPQDRNLEVFHVGHATHRHDLVLASGVAEFRLDVELAPLGEEPHPRVRLRLMRDGERVPDVEWFERASDVFLSAPRAPSGSPRLGRGRGAPNTVFGRTSDGWIGAVELRTDDVQAFGPRLVEAVRVAVVPGVLRTARGESVPGALVRVVSEGFWSPEAAERWLSEVETDDLGRFVVAVPPGAVTLEYGREPGAVQVHRLARPHVTPKGRLELVLDEDDAAAHELVGKVVDQAGEPIEGARVQSWTTGTRTDAQGAFRLGAGAGGVVVSHPRHVPETRFPAEGPLVVVLRAAREIRGRLDLGDDPTPIRRFRVRLVRTPEDGSGGTWHDVNDRDGRFVLGELADGTYDLRVVAEGRASRWIRDVEAQPLDTSDELVVPMPEPVVIHGVTRDPSGTTVGYATIEGVAVGSDGHVGELVTVASSDANGHFRWPVPQAGRYTLRARGSSGALVEIDAARDTEDVLVLTVD